MGSKYSSGVMAINLEGKIIVFNEAAQRLAGVRASQVLGQPIDKVLPGNPLLAVLKTGERVVKEEKVRDRILLLECFPLQDAAGEIIGAVEILQDITGIKTLEEEVARLKERESLLEAIIDCTQDAISVSDAQGNVVLVNRAYTALTGLKPEEVIGKPATVDIAEGESMHLKVVKTRQPVYGIPMKVGPHKKEVLVNVAPILVAGQLKGSVGVIHDVSEIRRLTRELDKVKRQLRYLHAKYSFEDIIGDSPLMQLAVAQAKKAAGTSATILLRGESGTGKELFAHAIHNASARKEGPFIRVNCAAIPDNLFESELFGYVEGAFTGAKKGGKRGLLEEASGGTIFLDEIAEMSIAMQSKLLRVLQEKEIIRVGDNKPVAIDVRVIAATNSNLEKAVEEKRFREDLYWRLSVFPIFIPPLRQRKEDIPRLARFFVDKYNHEYGRNVKEISPEVLDVLLKYSWPGNVRELENVIARAMINMHYADTVITLEHLPPLEKGVPLASPHQPDRMESLPALENSNLPALVREKEKEIILNALRQTGGNKTRAARQLGIPIRTLYYKLEQYGIKYKH
ncbi:transcriptional regulator [Thermanaeromonas toyohensis ToBE]|uniref:Transcriptional regulator n=1 Tax=Thermanaeromonas toyohensis ToBE TaxID=698762 RepID=A0A1W1V5E2_9FIRM|nr:sigma-54-dependent Fis family transcriptional regulator [Thermanaeromonas toyohensis]SMB88647.1 transcriptional regulator [Thermanaeromonas toyohensis ToBE]